MRRVTPREWKKPNGERRWRVHFPAALNGGKQRVKDFKKRVDAEEEAARINALIVAHKTPFHCLSIPAQSVLARLYSLCPRGVTDIETKILPRIDELVKHEPRTFAQVAEECVKDKERAKMAKEHRRALSWHLREFAAQFGFRDVATITTGQIGEWLYSREKWSPRTKKGCLISLNTAFNFAVTHNYSPFNPAEKVEKPKISKKPPCILTVEEAERLMRSAVRHDSGIIPYLALVLFGGLRPEEARRCKPEYVSGDVIDMPAADAKNNRRRLIEMNQPEMATLKAWLDIAPISNIKNWKKRFQKVRALAVIGECGPCKPIQWGHDIMRHSFVSYAVPMWGVMRTALLAEHSEDVLEHHYRRRVPRSDAERFWGIRPNLHRKQ